MRRALLAAALIAAPTLLPAQGSRVESIVITAASVRVRTAPSMSSLSIDEFRQGWVFPLASDQYQSSDWAGVIVDGRVAFVPRYAIAPKPRQDAPAHAATPGPTAPALIAASAPAPAPTAAPAPAPDMRVVTQAGMPATVATAVVAASAAAPRPAPSVPPAEVKRTPESTAERVPEKVAIQERTQAAERAPDPTPERAPESPVLARRRTGMKLTVGVLGSVTPIESNGVTRTVHVSGVSFVGARYRRVGVYVAPEFGQGGGYRSTTLEGGLSLDVVSLHLLRVTALGGYMSYSESPLPADSTIVPVTRSLRGTSVGGMVSIPFVGPLRLAYRGQYDTVRDAGIPISRTQHSVGFVF